MHRTTQFQMEWKRHPLTPVRSLQLLWNNNPQKQSLKSLSISLSLTPEKELLYSETLFLRIGLHDLVVCDILLLLEHPKTRIAMRHDTLNVS